MPRTTVNLTSADMERIGKIGADINQLFGELEMIFPEREDLLQQLKYAFLTQEHVLVFGTFGTGKSDMLNTLFDSFVGADKFSIDMSKFMTESNIIGLPNPKEMREHGNIKYCREGGILDAHFAELDELFDANPPLLRTLLGVLNERQFKRGRQFEKALLRTSIACTNADPEQVVRNNSDLGAVVDRFLFHCHVDYLKTPESRCRMFQKYLAGEKPSVEIPFADLEFISKIVVDANQITDPAFIDIYERVTEGFVVAQRKVDPNYKISDRRRCKLLQLVEANALLNGRYEPVYEDLLAVRWGICPGGDKDQHELFLKIAKPIIDEAVKALQPDVEVLSRQLLDSISAEIPEIVPTMTSDDLVAACRKFRELKEKTEAVKTDVNATKTLRTKILKTIDERNSKVMEKITKG